MRVMHSGGAPGTPPATNVRPTLTTGEVAEYLSLFERGGAPNRRLVRDLARNRKIPPPINEDIAVAHWSWSRAELDAYIAGQWTGVAS